MTAPGSSGLLSFDGSCELRHSQGKADAMHDVFISYSSEDNDFAAEIAYGLRTNGLSVWFAPLSLKAGDKLLDSIEQGLNESRAGILIISRSYLEKTWTSYEMDVLIRQHIERQKRILPVWLNVTKPDVERRHAGLSGIVAVTTTSPVEVIGQLVESLSEGAPSRAVIPSYEEPAWRFLQGLGEVVLQTSDGRATTIFGFLIHAQNEEYPLWLAGRTYSKEDLLYHVASFLAADPDRCSHYLSQEDYDKVWVMCVESGFDPELFC